MPNALLWLKATCYEMSADSKSKDPVMDDEVPEFVKERLKDGSGNKAVVIIANTGISERWTREWVEVIY